MTPRKQKENGIRGGAAHVSWCEREVLVGQNHILFYLIFSCCSKYKISTIKGVSKVSFLGSRM